MELRAKTEKRFKATREGHKVGHGGPKNFHREHARVEKRPATSAWGSKTLRTLQGGPGVR